MSEPLTDHRVLDGMRSTMRDVSPISPAAGGTLAALQTLVIGRLTPPELAVLRCRARDESLSRIGQGRGVSRARIHEIETIARGHLAPVLASVPEWIARWRSLLAIAPTAEDQLLAPHLAAKEDELAQRDLGHILLWVGADARPARVGGAVLPGYWMHRRENIAAKVRALGAHAPLADEQFAAAARAVGLGPELVRLVLSRPGCSLIHDERARGWVRRTAPVRDASQLLLTRWARPARNAALARVLGRPPSIVGAQPTRDSRFHRLTGRREWALSSWGDLGEGTRYRSTQDAIRAVLTGSAPLPTDELVRRVQVVHPVSVSAIRNWLHHEEFGRCADGRRGFSADGATPHDDAEPAVGPDVEVHDHRHLVFTVAVDRRVVRGSSVIVPHFVGWFLGLRRLPQRRVFARADGNQLVVTRRPGHSSVSSLQADVRMLGLESGCRLRIALDLVGEAAQIGTACRCHVMDAPLSRDGRA